MPGMSGWQLAERLRAFRRSTAVIFVTGWGLRDDEVARLKALGVTDCLFKPVQGHEVDTAIQTILSGV
jgi:DNA-binding response OmpR family regulator